MQTDSKPTVPHKEWWIHRFWKKRYKWIAVVGGLIISSSLALKESFDVHLRELSGAIEAERNVDLLNAASHLTNVKIDHLRDYVASLKETPKELQGALFKERFLNNSEIFASQLNFEAIRQLLPFLNASKDSKSLNILDYLEDKYKNQVITNKILAQLADEPKSQNPEFQKQIEYAMEEMKRITKDVESLRTITLNDLIEKRRKESQLARILTLIIYGLVGIGFALTLTAKAFEPPTETSVPTPGEGELGG